MTVNFVQEFEYTSKFISCVSVDNSLVFSTDDGLLIVVCILPFICSIFISTGRVYLTNYSLLQDIQSDLFRPTADYKVFRTSLPFSKEKPFEDKNFKEIRYQRPVVCQEHNLTVYPNSQK